MGQRAWVVLGVILATAGMLHADEWSKTYSIAGKPDLRVESSDANIHVDTWDQNTIEARVTSNRYKLGEKGLQVIEHQSGDIVELQLRYPHHNFLPLQIGNYRVEINIHMPRQGRVTLHTGDGNIDLSHFKGEMDLETGDGHQDVTGVDGSLHTHSGDGHIRADGRFDVLQVSTGDGRIEAQAQAGSAMTSNWELHTGDGSITLRLPESFAADVDLHTSDGHVTVDLPVAVEGRLGEKNIHGKINGGGNLLTVHTGDGSILIEKL